MKVASIRVGACFRTIGWFGLLIATCLTGCRAPSETNKQIQIYAASSMKEVMLSAKQAFEAQEPDAKLVFNFAGSQVLRLQIEQGAPADLYISANATHLQALKNKGLIQKERILAKNELVVITPADNPGQIEQLKDLSLASRIVIGTAQSPIGIYTRQLLQKATTQWGPSFKKHVMTKVVSEENNVRLIRAKITLGAADAALVYRTDTLNAPKIRTVTIPPNLNIKAAYVVALTNNAKHNPTARAFFQYLASAQGLALLDQHGFVVN